MPEQLSNILWMGEELDFQLNPEDRSAAVATIQEFLKIVANPAFSHCLYRTTR